MPFLFRTLMIWVLALVVPAQGLAAAMALCGPDHHGAPATVRTSLVESVGLTQGAALGHPPGHAHSTTQAAHPHHDDSAGATETASASEAWASSPDTQTETQSCSVCAACCTVGAITSAPTPLPVADFAATVFPSLVFSVDAFAAGGPERPPRFVLA